MKISNTTFQSFLQEMMKKPEISQEFATHDLPFEVAQTIIEARIKKGVTQKQLAEKMKTSQSSIARAESGTYLPNLGFFQKMADALDTYVIPPKMGFMSEQTKIVELIQNIPSYSLVDTLIDSLTPAVNTNNTRSIAEAVKINV